MILYMLLLAFYYMTLNDNKIYSSFFFFYSVGYQNMGLGKYINALMCPALMLMNECFINLHL